MDSDLYEQQWRVEQEHWWFRARRHIILTLLDGHASQPSNGRLQVCDLGCGTGGNLAAIADRYDVYGVDKAPEAVAFARQRLGDCVRVGALPDCVELESNRFDGVLITDVLEHVEDDKGSLATALRILRPGGIIVATVPANPWLYCDMDRRLHHFRRYNKGQFRELLNVEGADVRLLSHFNTLLFPAAGFLRFVSKIVKSRDAILDLEVPAGPINRILEPVLRSEAFLLDKLTLPFGLSLVAVVRKK